MKKLYLSLAIIGAIVPYIFFFQFIQAEGLNIPAFISALFVNGAAGGFSADLLLASCIFWLFYVSRSQRIRWTKTTSIHCPESYYWIVLRPCQLTCMHEKKRSNELFKA